MVCFFYNENNMALKTETIKDAKPVFNSLG